MAVGQLTLAHASIGDLDITRRAKGVDVSRPSAYAMTVQLMPWRRLPRKTKKAWRSTRPTPKQRRRVARTPLRFEIIDAGPVDPCEAVR